MKRFLILGLLISILITLMACSVSFNLFDKPSKPTLIVPPTQKPGITAPAQSPLPTVVIVLPTPKKPAQTITVYFLDENRFIVGTDPYEVAVTRIPADPANLPLAVLNAYFEGPTPQEYAQGLRMHGSGFTYVREFKIENGVAHVHLGGVCANNGAAYSVAALIFRNLEQFPQIAAIKIYDENDSTGDTDSNTSSIPYCLEP